MLRDDLLDGAEAAGAYVGLPARTIYHLTEQKRLPCVRMGRRLYYRKSELEAAFRSKEDA